MILKQELIDLQDGRGGVKLINTYDTSIAQDLAKQVNDFGDNSIGDKRDKCELMGFIPPEMWLYDIHLRAAREALIYEHNNAKYTKYVREFFKHNPQFATQHNKKFY